jgi:hypothetical protein
MLDDHPFSLIYRISQMSIKGWGLSRTWNVARAFNVVHRPRKVMVELGRRPAMLIRRHTMASLVILVVACIASLANAWAADTPAKAVLAEVTTVSTPPSTARARELRLARYQRIRRQAALARYRACTYLGCPGHLILGIGF